MPPDDGAPRGGSTRLLPRWLLIVAAALLVARIGTGIYEERHPPAAADLVHWRTIEAGLVEARQQAKPLLYDFTADWCPPCRAMQREVFADPQSAESIERLFVPVRVLDRMREEGRNASAVDSLQRAYKIDSFPTLVVTSPDTGHAPAIFPGYGGRTGTIQNITQAAAKLQMGGMFQMTFPGGKPSKRP